jgi:serine phosphatase RsbU (regulator of sigma subunit)
MATSDLPFDILLTSWPNRTRPDQLDLIIGDVSGKGIAAALLLANAGKLRSQSAIALDHPEILLRSVNRMFHENMVDGAFASLFYLLCGLGRPHPPRLRYAHCGHLSGLLLGADETCQRLDSTATLLGPFQRRWGDGRSERRNAAHSLP